MNKQLRVTYDPKDARKALKKVIPHFGQGIIINTAHGDLSLHEEDAQAVMDVVQAIAQRRGGQPSQESAPASYVLNAQGHYFVVKCRVDTGKLQGCELFDTYDALMEAVCRRHGLEREEVEALEIVVTRPQDVFLLSWDRGISSEFTSIVETEISTFSL